MSEKTERLSQAKIDSWLANHPKWALKDEKLYRHFQFKDFEAAFAWMTRIAQVAEKKNHHPEWLNVYNQVRVWLTTHDCEGISTKDLELAEEMGAGFERT